MGAAGVGVGGAMKRKVRNYFDDSIVIEVLKPQPGTSSDGGESG